MSSQPYTEVLGEDGLSRLVRRFLAAESPSSSVEDETEEILNDLRAFLIERGFYDPMSLIVFRDGKSDGETLGAMKSWNTLLDMSLVDKT